MCAGGPLRQRGELPVRLRLISSSGRESRLSTSRLSAAGEPRQGVDECQCQYVATGAEATVCPAVIFTGLTYRSVSICAGLIPV